MGIIRKKNSRGQEGGVKYVCDVCSSDITSTVRISCEACNTILCVSCFAQGKSTRDHDPATHPYHVIEQHSIPIFMDDWGADEELLLLEGAEMYGLGSWVDIADHIGGCRNKDEVRDHYIKTYIDSPNFPLPVHASKDDRSLIDEIPRETFQANKKRRIEERKEMAKNASPAAPKQKPTASHPACHEVQGYMPGRLEFETEYFNEAEEAVQHMQFEPGDGVLPMTPEQEQEFNLKMTIMAIYNERLTARVERKKIIFEHNLLEYKKAQAADKKRNKEERELINRAKPFARMMKNEDFQTFTKGLELEHSLRTAIAQMQEWRAMGITDLKSAEKYETEKAQRISRGLPTLGAFDRLTSSRLNKPTPPVEASSTVSALVSSDLTLPPYNGDPSAPSLNESEWPLSNGHSNGRSNGHAVNFNKKYQIQPLPNQPPITFDENVPDLHLLTPEERELCRVIRVQPKPYLIIKDTILREAVAQGGALKKKQVRDLCKIDVLKGSRIFDFFVQSGWIQKA
ncbi:transcriptional adapter 2 [Trichodelitschia bisporula]|uniref:Transcriptional adapter 2 n=1 Tax=Trichodelitschia bisporula TaxID=703511 RepID=A0A6G1I551_9PEZI|nr:transcriptional adapter 2 [Trichodelitschia bisporula]